MPAEYSTIDEINQYFGDWELSLLIHDAEDCCECGSNAVGMRNAVTIRCLSCNKSIDLLAAAYAGLSYCDNEDQVFYSEKYD